MISYALITLVKVLSEPGKWTIYPLNTNSQIYHLCIAILTTTLKVKAVINLSGSTAHPWYLSLLLHWLLLYAISLFKIFSFSLVINSTIGGSKLIISIFQKFGMKGMSSLAIQEKKLFYISYFIKIFFQDYLVSFVVIRCKLYFWF